MLSIACVALIVSACAADGSAPPPTTGWLVITVTDAATGEPITDCQYYGYRTAAAKEEVESQPHIEVDTFREIVSETGIYRWQFAPGWHQLRLEADDYWRTWTPVFQIEAGKETKLAFEMRRNILLRVKVFDADGSPLEEGRVRVEMNSLVGSVAIQNGVGEVWVEDDEVTLGVGRIWLKEYREQSVTATLRPGETNEVTIHLTK
jgi:hypothetical protein